MKKKSQTTKSSVMALSKHHKDQGMPDCAIKFVP